MLTVLLLDPQTRRRQRIRDHLSSRFRVLACSEPVSARSFLRSDAPHAVLAHLQIGWDSGARFLLNIDQQKRRTGLILFGSDPLEGIDEATRERLDAWVPGSPEPPLLEAVVWDVLVRLHGDGGLEGWQRMLDEEPSLGPVRQVIREQPGGDPTWQQLKELLHTEILPAKNPASAPVPHRVGMLFQESDEPRRTAILEQLKGRVVPVFAKHRADVGPLLARNRVKAVVVRLEPGARVRLGWVERLRKEALDPDFALVVHGAGDREAIPGVDEQLAMEVAPEMLEVVVWDQMLAVESSGRYRPVARAPRSGSVASANRSEDEIQENYSWGDLLQAEANLAHLKLLLRRRIGSQAPPLVEDSSLSHLLRQDVSLENLKRLATYEVKLFGES